MKRKPSILIHVKADRLLAYRLDDETPSAIELGGVGERFTAELADALNEHLDAASAVAIALPTSWCFCGTAEMQDVSAAHRRRQLLFKLEAVLPADAEALVADFVIRPDAAFGIATRHDRLDAFIRRLEHHGHAVCAVTPATLLALTGESLETAGTKTSDRTPARCVIAQDGAAELLAFDERGPYAWRHVPLDAAVVRDHLAGWRSDGEDQAPIRLVNAPTAFVDAWLDLERDDETTDVEEVDIEQCLIRHARDILADRLAPPVQLARDRLAPAHRWSVLRTPLKVAAASVLLGVACVIAALLIRTEQYGQLAADHRGQLTELYQQTLDTRNAPPSGVRRRLASRLREVEGLRSPLASSSGSARRDLPGNSPDAVAVLYACLERLPTNQRLLVLEVHVDRDRVTLTGQARSHGDAGRLIQALNRHPRLAFDDPRTRQLRNEQGVGFTAAGRYRSAVDPSSSGGAVATIVPSGASGGEGEGAP